VIVVTGATGNVGRHLTGVLTAAGEQVRAVSRRPPGDGTPHWRADLAEPATLRSALTGADALFLLVAGEDPRAVLDLAEAGGVRRVVLLSSLGARTRPQGYPHPRAFEDAVRDSSLEWTILRPGGFHSNTYAWADSVRARRTVEAPFGDIGLPSVDPTDIAEVAAVALREAGHCGRVHELTGPAPITPRAQAEAIGAALGAPVRFVERTRDEARARMRGFMPEPVVEATLDILGAPTADERTVSPAVERILGRRPRSFAGWAARNVAAFR
jgi:uncharacterized protein YbjT (DUF2867 family)